MTLVTGATGFVGKAVVQRLLAEDESRKVAVSVRRDGQQWPDRVLHHVMGYLVVDVNYPDRSATTILAGGSGE